MKAKGVSPEFVREFSDSLPDEYRKRYTAQEVLEHAQVSRRRDGREVAVGFFGRPRGTARGVCVVGDDRPGLLATISAGFVLADLDVVSAEAYTRMQPRAKNEAVDLFYLRRLLPDGQFDAPGDDDLEALHSGLARLLRGDAEAREYVERRSSPPDQRIADATVRFLDDGRGSLATLEVETDDRSGLLLALATALFNQRVQIVRSQVKTNGERVLDRFTVVEFDGSPIAAARRLEIQVAVLSAIEPARRTGRPPPDTT